MVDLFLDAGWFQLHWYYDIVEVAEEINMLCMYTVIRGVFGPLLLCVFHGSWSGVLKGFPWKRFLPGFYGSNQQKGCDPWMKRLISCTIWGCLKHLAKFSEPSTVWLQGSRWPISSTKSEASFEPFASSHVSGWWVSTEHATEFGIAIVAWKSPPYDVSPGVMLHNMTSGQKNPGKQCRKSRLLKHESKVIQLLRWRLHTGRPVLL